LIDLLAKICIPSSSSSFYFYFSLAEPLLLSNSNNLLRLATSHTAAITATSRN